MATPNYKPVNAKTIKKGARCARYIIPSINSTVQANPLKILTKL